MSVKTHPNHLLLLMISFGHFVIHKSCRRMSSSVKLRKVCWSAVTVYPWPPPSFPLRLSSSSCIGMINIDLTLNIFSTFTSLWDSTSILLSSTDIWIWRFVNKCKTMDWNKSSQIIVDRYYGFVTCQLD